MRHKRLVFLALSTMMATPLLAGCAAKILEEELTVVFMNGDEIIETGKVTQFQNVQSPTLSDAYLNAYLASSERFLGWTPYALNQLDYSDATNFKSQYISAGRMVHYMEVKDFAFNSTVVLKTLILDKDDIPKDYHYGVVAWYDKVATSGLSSGNMSTYEGMTREYLSSEGVSEYDLSTLVFRAYAGNVGPTTGQILYDDDVDIMMGWGSLDNISTTGSIPVEMVKESIAFPILYGGAVKTRYIHRLTDNPGALKIWDYLKSEATANYFNPQ